jgi:N-acetylglutamate synthase-like GNAT family acetyltransferase
MAEKTREAREASLRAATARDLAAIEQLLTSSGLPTAGVADALRDFIVAESEDDNRVVGVVGLELCGEEYALLRSAAVEPEWRGTGLGRRLVTHVIADAESRGIKALYLLTTTAERCFPSFGFVPTRRDVVPDAIKQSVEFREACPATATVMALDLG